MIVKELIDELNKYDANLPICINDYMGFAEAYEKSIITELKTYIAFPFTENDKFLYINLKSNE